MKICLVHNAYSKYSGEEAVVAGQQELLEENGHSVCMFSRSSAEIPEIFLGQLRAFLSGIYNPFSRRAFRDYLRKERPDVVHVHNLYPMVSPSILPIARQLGIPVVMTVHNYRLVCPNGMHYVHGEVCMRCEGGHEYWCVKRNCMGSIIKSFGYVLRNWWSRRRRYYLDNVSIFACLTGFQRDSLVRAGVDAGKIDIVPNMVELPAKPATGGEGKYVGFSGRLTCEKGVDTLVDVARGNDDIEFAAAGSFDSMPGLAERVPGNFSLLGHCDAGKLGQFYGDARFLVLPSVWFEGFPMVLLEAMLMEKAIICSDIGGLSDIVDNGVTGLLARPGDAADLGDKIRKLWSEPELCRKMGIAGRDKVLREYSKRRHYERLMDVYKKAITK
ncbi:MAG: glycosyltransferase family 4 protein [Gammaproteobacteria bacterium]|nr:glycosyltransferase family 4 protein [Gammaproteobacteria bacterium]